MAVDPLSAQVRAVLKAAAAGPVALPPKGTTVEARVAAVLADGTLRLATSLGEVTLTPADGATPRVAVGDRLTLTVGAADASGRTTVSLDAPPAETAPADPSAAVLARAIASAAARQKGLAGVFPWIERLAADPAAGAPPSGSAAVPPGVREAAAVVRRLGLRLEPPPDAAAVARSVRGSGLFLEADLARGRPVAGDLKAALLNLARALDAWARPAGGAVSGASGPQTSDTVDASVPAVVGGTPLPREGGSTLAPRASPPPATAPDAGTASATMGASTTGAPDIGAPAARGPGAGGAPIADGGDPAPGAALGSAGQRPAGASDGSAAGARVPNAAAGGTPLRGDGSTPGTGAPGASPGGGRGGGADIDQPPRPLAGEPAGRPGPAAGPSGPESGPGAPTAARATMLPGVDRILPDATSQTTAATVSSDGDTGASPVRPAGDGQGARDSRPVGPGGAADRQAAQTTRGGSAAAAPGPSAPDPNRPPPTAIGPAGSLKPDAPVDVSSPFPARPAGAQPQPFGTAAPDGSAADRQALARLLGLTPDVAASDGAARLDRAGRRAPALPGETGSRLDTDVPRPPPRRHGPLAAEPPAPRLAADLPLAEMAHVARQEVEASIARIVLAQVASLPPDAEPGAAPKSEPSWTFEIPLQARGETAVAQFRIGREEGRRSAAGEPLPPVWRVRFAVDLPPAGPVHAQVSLAGGHVSIGLWAERPEAAQALGREVGLLRAALEASDFTVDDIRLAEGEPPRNAVAGTPLVDRTA